MRPMRCQPGIAFVFAITLAVAACSGGGGGGGGGTRVSPDPGESSDTLGVFVNIACVALAEDSAGLANCPALVDIHVAENTDEGLDVDDALVVLTPWEGEPMTVASNGNGGYRAMFTGYAEAFQVDITRGSDFLTGAVLVSPIDFDVSIDPDPPQVGTAATVYWSPTEAMVNSLVFVRQEFVTTTYQGAVEGDDGVEMLPGSAFPEADDYQIEVGRGRLQSLSGGFSQGIVVVGKVTSVTVE